MTPARFIDGIRSGDSHAGGIRCLQLFRVEPHFFLRLKSDVERLCALRQPSRPAAAGHVTQWTAPRGAVTQYSLLNRSGRTDDFSSDHDLSCEGKWFYDAAIAPALDEFISVIPHLINFRAHVIGPGAALPAHEEHVMFRARDGKAAARLRFHLPIETNPCCELVLDGAVYALEPGYVYLVNQGCVHAARNRGKLQRTHLVWDALLTGRLFEFLFLQPSPKFMTRLPECELSPSATEPVGPYRRLQPNLSQDEANSLGLCKPQ
jgi:hypothetical protein